MLTFHDRLEPVFLYAGGNGDRHVWLGLLTPQALQFNAGMMSQGAVHYSDEVGQKAIDTVLRAMSIGAGGHSAPNLMRKLGNGIRASLSLRKDSSFTRALRLCAPQGRYCFAFRQVLDDEGQFTWSVDPLQSLIDPDSGTQRVGEGFARFALNEPTRVHVSSNGVYRAWYVQVLG